MAYWKSLPIITSGGSWFECSNCGYYINICDYELLLDQCPNCGEDMGDIGAKINWRKDETVTTAGVVGTVILPKYGMNGWQKDETKEARSDSFGWICPVCGRGLSPFTQFCPCKGYPIY